MKLEAMTLNETLDIMRSWRNCRLRILIVLAISFVFLITYFYRSKSMMKITENHSSIGTELRKLARVPVSKVIVFSYWRSGSSVLGELFNQHPRAFYVFEPSNGLDYPIEVQHSNVIRKPDGHLFLKGLDFQYGNEHHTDQELSMMLYGLLNCNLSHVPESTLAYRFTLKSKSLYEFNFCRETPAHALECSHLILPVCRRAPVRAIKDVHLTFGAMIKLLTADADVKVIHLLRDPRAVAYSVSESFYKQGKNPDYILTKAREMCKQMYFDIRERHVFFEKFSTNIMQVLYEEFAEDPVMTTKKIYKFINTEVPSDVLDWVAANTNSKASPEESEFQTIRKNSTATAYSWKHKLSFSTVKQIQEVEHCSSVMKAAGYIPVRSEIDLLDDSLRHRIVKKSLL